MIGILCEKKSAARNFAKALGGMSGTFNGEQYTIVAAHGHLYELKKPEMQVRPELTDRYKSWNVSNLPWNETDFQWIRERKADEADLLKNLKSTLSTVDELCCAGDLDPFGEGFLISAEIIQELKLRPRVISRMYFEDESQKAIQKAFINRKPVPDITRHDEYVMAWYRTRWDFLSMQFTRIATQMGDGQSLLRQGRLKSAMVLLVGQQLDAVAGYKKIPFYQNRFRDENGATYISEEEPRFEKKEQVPQTYHPSAVVVDSKTRKTTPPPKYLDLAGLAAILAEKGYKAKDVLAVYQKMYESQVVSYPRTEDQFITEEQFNKLLPLVDKIAGLVGVDPGLLTHRTPRTSTHVKTGGVHGANRPDVNVPDSLDDLKQYGDCAEAIYVILARNYLASLAEDYEYEAQKGHLQDYPKFVGSVSVPQKPGWKAVYQDQDDEEENDNSAATQGLGTLAQPFIHEGFPKKPQAPTLKWLKNQLGNRDVGTGATRTSTYAEITNEKSQYPLLVDKRGKISLTQYGEMSYKLLPGTHIGDLSITERVQTQIRGIVAGTLDPDACLREIQQMVKDDIAVMQANGSSLQKAPPPSEKEYCEGTWGGKQIHFNRVFRGHRFTDAECAALLNGEEIELRDLVSSKTRSTYGVKGKLTNQTYNGRKFVGFESTGFLNDGPAAATPGTPSGQAGIGLPGSWCGHKFSTTERQRLANGSKIKVNDAISRKTGKKFSCYLEWKDEGGEKRLVPTFS